MGTRGRQHAEEADGFVNANARSSGSLLSY